MTMSKIKGKSKSTNCLTNNKLEVTALVDKIHKHNLEKIRNENISYRNKRKRKISDSSIDEIIQEVVNDMENEGTVESKCNPEANSTEMTDNDVQKYLEWKSSEFDTYNSISRSTVLQSIDILEKIYKEKSKKKKFKKNCSTLDQMKSAEILWSSTTYIVKYIRLCILQQNWKSLSYLLSHFLNHSKQYRGYIKEITFLASLMASKQDSTIMENLEQCFIKKDTKQECKFDIWFVNDKEILK